MAEYLKNNEVLFSEYHAAAQSLKSGWTRLASTYRCIMVVLYKKKLVIKPHWFARWLINLLVLDLHHEIPVENIRYVMETGKWFNYGKVELHFLSAEGEDKKILLFIKKSREFVDKLTSILEL